MHVMSLRGHRKHCKTFSWQVLAIIANITKRGN
jgi:hypothetical protein